ncbi:MAG: phosphatase PAP2 family protein [Alphaproteobacteria bacterium]
MQNLVQRLSMKQCLTLTAILVGMGGLSVPAAYAAQNLQQAAGASQTQSTASRSAAKPTLGHYISVKEIAALPAPRANKSSTIRTDILHIIGFQTYAAPEEITAARDEQNLRPEHLVSVIDKNVSQTELPLTFALLDRVAADVSAVTRAAKKRWRTTRPYQLDRRVKLLVDPLAPDNYGYPSGHTSLSLVWADILAELDPAAAAPLQQQAARIAMHRVLAGVHTTQDITGGKKLGTAILAALKTKPAFQSDLAAARAEFTAWRAATAPSGRKNWKSFKSRVTK